MSDTSNKQQMKCLHRMLGVSRRDRFRNEDIRKKMGTTSVLNFIKKQQTKWFGYISRLPTCSEPQKGNATQIQ
uniref:Uncharacterized protein n=1 Tax=Arion vulgaris TaxID=1028688 RepID=A0A0B7BLT6_9EUPU